MNQLITIFSIILGICLLVFWHSTGLAKKKELAETQVMYQAVLPEGFAISFLMAELFLKEPGGISFQADGMIDYVWKNSEQGLELKVRKSLNLHPQPAEFHEKYPLDRMDENERKAFLSEVFPYEEEARFILLSSGHWAVSVKSSSQELLYWWGEGYMIGISLLKNSEQQLMPLERGLAEKILSSIEFGEDAKKKE